MRAKVATDPINRGQAIHTAYKAHYFMKTGKKKYINGFIKCVSIN